VCGSIGSPLALGVDDGWGRAGLLLPVGMDGMDGWGSVAVVTSGSMGCEWMRECGKGGGGQTNQPLMTLSSMTCLPESMQLSLFVEAEQPTAVRGIISFSWWRRACVLLLTSRSSGESFFLFGVSIDLDLPINRLINQLRGRLDRMGRGVQSIAMWEHFKRWDESSKSSSSARKKKGSKQQSKSLRQHPHLSYLFLLFVAVVVVGFFFVS
jgi:hypothetical protein